MSLNRSKYAGQMTRAQLPPQTLREIEEAYLQILNGTGFGKIRIMIENAGGSKERQFVSVEQIKKTQPAD